MIFRAGRNVNAPIILGLLLMIMSRTITGTATTRLPPKCHRSP
jgi:hypothetical protein